MRIVPLVFVLVCFAPFVVPVGGAQSTVAGCKTQCDPQEPDVNDPPVRTSGTVNVVLYAHAQTTIDRGLLNVFPPDATHERDATYSSFYPSAQTPCVVTSPCSLFADGGMSFLFCPGGLRFSGDQWHYDCHDRTTGVPLQLGDGPLLVYAYVSANAIPSVLSPPERIGVVPLLDLAASITEEKTGQQAGRPLASSVPGSARLSVVSMPGESDVYEVPIELVAAQDVWPAQTSENLRLLHVRGQQVSQSGVEATQGDWRFHIGHPFAPRLILPVRDPITLETEYFVKGTSLHVRAFANSVFGGYDIDGASLRIEQVSGARLDAPTLVSLDLVEPFEHDFRGAPAMALWQYDLSRAPAGDYQFNISAANQQGTFVPVKTETYAVAAFGGRAVAGPGLASGVVVALAVAWARRLANA